MKLTQAQALKPKAVVTTPEDRGQPGYKGIVVSVGTEVYENINGTDYIWVEVKTPWSTKAVWPSNRLK